MQKKPISPLKTNYLVGKTSKPCRKMYSTQVCICATATGAQKDHHISRLADASKELVPSCLVITMLLSVKWLKMFDKHSTKPSKEMLPF